MRLITFHRNRDLIAGAVVEGHAVDLARASKALGSGSLPGTIREMLEGGEPVMAKVRKAVRRAESKLAGLLDSRERRPAWAIPIDDVRLAPPIPNPEKVICIGQNYIDHCREQNVEPPKSPIIFTKFATTLTGPNDEVHLPPEEVTVAVDYEVELAFVIGHTAKRVKKRDAMEHVAGLMVMNDITARDVQRGDGQWVRGKSFDTFGPCGPWLLTMDEAPDPMNLHIWLKLNGEMMQDSSTSNLIFDIPFLIEYLSRGLTFNPGDIVSTGTPPGVGIFRKPPVVLKPGDLVEAGIDGLGSLNNRITRDR